MNERQFDWPNKDAEIVKRWRREERRFKLQVRGRKNARKK